MHTQPASAWVLCDLAPLFSVKVYEWTEPLLSLPMPLSHSRAWKPGATCTPGQGHPAACHVSLGLYTTATEGTGLYTLREWLHTLVQWPLPHSVYVLWISWLRIGRSYTHLPAWMTPRTLSGKVQTWSFNKALGFS